MPVYMVTARWTETYTVAVNADSPDEAENYINTMVCDGGISESMAQRHIAGWSLHTPYEAHDDIDPRKLLDARDR